MTMAFARPTLVLQADASRGEAATAVAAALWAAPLRTPSL